MPRFTPAALFSDGAVLCRRKEIRVFGAAPDGLVLTATLTDARGAVLSKGTAPAQNGKFCVYLPPLEAQVGCALSITDGQDTLLFCDIAVGDVYLAGGQSNMELELQNADEGKKLYPTHANAQVRYFNVPKRARWDEEAIAANRAARWLPIAPGTAKDMSAVAYFFAMKLQPRLQIPIGIIDCYWGGTSITCWMDEDALQETAEGQRYLSEYDARCQGVTMEAYIQAEKAFFDGLDVWAKKADALKAVHPEYTTKELNAEIGPCPPWNPPAGPGSPFRPAGLFHTMLERVIPATLTGVLFYQGEEDSWRTERYDILLSSFIARLRALFMDGELPFLNVQLPMWIDGAAESDSKLWPRLRQAQQTVYRATRNSGLAVLLDQGEFDNIHPTNKRVVGERLYECALDAVYHLPARLSPFALSKAVKDGVMQVRLSAPVLDRGQGDTLMELAGTDGCFHPAFVQLEGDALLLSSAAVPHPVSARYAWTDYAIVRFFGENGLPLAPFVLN